MTLWIALVAAYVVTHFLATFLIRCGRVLGKIFSFVDDVVSAILDVTRVVVEVIQKIGSAVDDFFSGRWDELGHESAGSVPTLRTPVVLRRLAALADVDDRDLESTAFLTALGRLVRLLSDDDDDDDDDHRGGGYCGFWRYASTIDLTRWVVAEPLSAIFPGLCDGSRAVDGVHFVFRDLPVVLRWIGTAGLALFLALVTFRPLTVWAIRETWRIASWGLTRAFRGLRRCAIAVAPPDDPAAHHPCFLCLRDFAPDAGDRDLGPKTSAIRRRSTSRGLAVRPKNVADADRQSRAVVALANGRLAHASCSRRFQKWMR